MSNKKTKTPFPPEKVVEPKVDETVEPTIDAPAEP